MTQSALLRLQVQVQVEQRNQVTNLKRAVTSTTTNAAAADLLFLKGPCNVVSESGGGLALGKACEESLGCS